MNPLKRLLVQTAIYGLPTIIGRVLNYFLVPLYTFVFVDTADYGVVSELYAWVAFLIVLLKFGMETAFFRFVNDSDDKESVFKNSFLTVIAINGLFILVVLIFNQQIANALLYAQHPEYILLLGLIVCVDSISALPMARLRAMNKALQFSVIHLISIGVNIALNLIFMLLLFDPSNPEDGVLFILIANLIASLVKPLAMYKDFLKIRWTLNVELAKKMLYYAFPLVLAGFAGIINETIDRVMLKHILHNQAGYTLHDAEAQLGIYSACYKLAMLVTIFFQAYRYAAEPFFFAQQKNVHRNTLYVKIMNYFIAVVCLLFLLVSLNIDVFKHFIRNEAYWDGLHIVPVLLMANVFFGIYLNQSIWYKLSDQTKFGAYIAVGGAILTIILNLIFIPIYGYLASAWATLIVYAMQMAASYFLGQKYYPIHYDRKKFAMYLGLATGIFFLAYVLNLSPKAFSWYKFFIHNALIVLFAGVVIAVEKPLKKLKF